MLMDQEWDTRTWTNAKVHAAIETLYSEIETSPNHARRDLAATMIIRLLEMHEGRFVFLAIIASPLSEAVLCGRRSGFCRGNASYAVQ